MSDVRDRYQDPGGFRAALTQRLRRLAEQSGWTLAELQRQFAFDRFLQRLNARDGGWVLKGAAALLAREVSLRATRDVDLYRRAAVSVVRPFVDPILAGTATGSWDPVTLRWRRPQARPLGPTQTGIFDGPPAMGDASSSPGAKVALFASMFAARSDVYAVRGGLCKGVAPGLRDTASTCRLGDDQRVAFAACGQGFSKTWPLTVGAGQPVVDVNPVGGHSERGGGRRGGGQGVGRPRCCPTRRRHRVVTTDPSSATSAPANCLGAYD